MRLLILACFLAATACGPTSLGPTSPGNTSPGNTVSLNERFTLAVGDAATIDRTGLRLQFVGVSADSRCPADAFCIQAGSATVQVRLIEGGASRAYELHSGDATRTSLVHGRVRLELVDVQPFPFSSRTIGPGEYRASFTARDP